MNSLNTSIERQRLTGLKEKKPRGNFMLSTKKPHFKHKESDWLAVNRERHQANSNQKKAGVVILV